MVIWILQMCQNCPNNLIRILEASVFSHPPSVFFLSVTPPISCRIFLGVTLPFLVNFYIKVPSLSLHPWFPLPIILIFLSPLWSHHLFSHHK